MKTLKKISIVALSIAAYCVVAPMASASASAEPLTGEEVREKVTDNYGDILSCYKKHALKQKTAKGEVNVRWVVEKQGNVDTVKVQAPGVKGDAFESCVTSEVQSWSFREIAGATEVEYPFLFQRTRAPGAGPTHR